MSLHKEMVLQKFEDFKIYFGQTLDLIGDAIDSANVLFKNTVGILSRKYTQKM